MRMRLAAMTAALAALCAVTGVAAAAISPPGKTDVKPYVKAVNPNYDVEALLSVGDDVPEEDAPAGSEFQMVGIPDGLGAYEADDGGDANIHAFVNHEFDQDVTSEPRVGRPLQRGSFVSEYTLDEEGDVHTGKRAFHSVYQDNTYVGPAAQEDNTTRAFARFCSAFLALPEEVGFDRPIYLTGEESRRSSPESDTEAFSPDGSQTVAIYDDRAHALSRFGKFAKENTIVAPGTGEETVAFSLEDGPTSPDSQLYMYVGTKRPGASRVLRRNGLDNGKLYVFAADDDEIQDERDFDSGTVGGHWELIPDAQDLDEVELEAAADERGALGFVRMEDGAFGPGADGQKWLHFVTTGDNAAVNRLGRGYRLRFKPNDPLGSTDLEVIYNADEVDEDGGDTAFSPDNVDVSDRYLAINEDGTASSRPELEGRDRDGSIWLFDLRNGYFPRRVAELVGRSEGGRDGQPTTAGIWETSGIIDTSQEFGQGSWLFDVQAHPSQGGAVTPEPEPNTVEDGQLLLLRRK